MDVKQELEEIHGLEAPVSTSPNHIDENAETEDDEADYRLSPHRSSSTADADTSLLVLNERKQAEATKVVDTSSTESVCSICSMANGVGAGLCLACSHVLDTAKVPEHWRCQSEVCKESEYLNPGDFGLCSICGNRKPDFAIT